MRNLHRMLLIALVANSLFAQNINQPAAASPRATAPVLITALHAYGAESERDEAVRITNVSGAALTLDAGWVLRDDRDHSFEITPALTLAPGAHAWLAHQAPAFVRRFGFSPTLVFGATPTFPDSGGHVQLITRTTALRDTANGDGGAWPAPPTSGHANRSMERRDPGAVDEPANWGASTAHAPGLLDNGSNPISGTPGLPNSLLVASPAPTTRTIAINEIAWAGTRSSASHEWLELYNNSAITQSLLGWALLITTTSSSASVPLTGSIGPNGFYVVARNGDVFGGTLRPDQTSSSLSFSNSGATVSLLQTSETLIDSVAWGNGSADGWLGQGLLPYTRTSAFKAEGQLLLRKPGFADGDSAADWINPSTHGIDDGKPVLARWHMYETFATPVRAQSHVTVAVAPDASFATLRDLVSSANSTLDIEAYTFDNHAIVQLLQQRIAAGVRVRLLLDGDPVGGLGAQNKWACQQISTLTPDSGCWFMRSVTGTHDYEEFPKRYENLHAKFVIVDGRQVMVGTENLGARGFPADDFVDGTSGHRGTLVILDAPEIVARAQAIFDADFSPVFGDITRWDAADPKLGLPYDGFVPITITGGTGYKPRFAQPLVLSRPVTVELASSPESHLSRKHGLIHLLDSLEAGDEILSEQLNEPHFWGAGSSNPTDDPNPRVASVVAAGERGVSVTMLLDGHYALDRVGRGNYSTTLYVNTKFSDFGARARAVMANPTNAGIHNKLYLVHRKQGGYAQIGSWNGTETSAKLNRELTALIESDEVFSYLKKVVLTDLKLSQPTYLPALMNNFTAPQNLTYPLISEALFSPIGLDEGNEWVELYNTGSGPLDLTGFKIGDAEAPGRNTADGMHRFPDGYVMAPNKVLVIAQDASKLRASYAITADFELIDSDPNVPQLLPYSAWSTGVLQLNNTEDQILLLGPQDQVLDVLQWGRTVHAGCNAFTGTLQSGHTLQRFPADKDTDNCAVDFRDHPFGTPGEAP